MRSSLAALSCLSLSLGACSLVLEDPLPFGTPDGGQADTGDARPSADTGPNDRDIPDLRELDQGTFDGQPQDLGFVDGGSDAHAPDGALPDQGPDDGGCIPQVEVCDGIDNDCDRAVDELIQENCTPCGPEGEEGLCAFGALLCVNGSLQCIPWLPNEDTAVSCDLLDNDCDGLTDEQGERTRARSSLEDLLHTECRDRPGSVMTPPSGGCTVNPRVVGCEDVHACLSPACRADCDAARAASSACEATCAGAEADVCRGLCRTDAESDWLACLTNCEAGPESAERWTCTGGVDGAECTAQRCPEGYRPAGWDCEPNVEICNNGKDDDGDGLIDASRVNDPCMVTFDQGESTRQMGLCRDYNGPGCEDITRMAGLGSIGSAESCFGDECPRNVSLSYRYAMDREEVSNRAYAECVAAGCCLRAEGRSYYLAEQAIRAGAPPRPENPDRCPLPVDPLEPSDDIVDLPVTGVTWCQARDYCNWVGKRLATEYEWETAASGLGAERRTYPWGNAEPPECREDACCRADTYEGAVPLFCDGELSLCTEEQPEAVRPACMTTHGAGITGTCTQVAGPVPVWGNRDGQTPEGLLNMSGNVGEWVFDYANTRGYVGLSTHDPVGPACDYDTFPDKRITRGEAFVTPYERLRNIERNPLFASSRLPVLGIRCARTVPDDGDRCEPAMPEVVAACRPGANIPDGDPGQPVAEPCQGPDFEAVTETDLAACPGASGRVPANGCSRGLDSFCASTSLAGCGAMVFTRFALPPALMAVPEVSSLFNAVTETALVSRGGSTIMAISVPETFDLVDREWNAAMGSAQVDADGELAWLSTFESGVCLPPEIISFRMRTIAGRRDLPAVCGAMGQGKVVYRSAPISIAFSAMGLLVNYEPGNETMSGSLNMIVTPADLQRSSFGGGIGENDPQGMIDLLDALNLHAENRCGKPLVTGCEAQPLLLPGCELQDSQWVCTTPDTCTGVLLPFQFEAVRAHRANIPGLLCEG